MDKIYLDNNATTPLDPRVKETMVDYLDQFVANPSSVHYFGQQARMRLQKARQTVANYLQVKPSEIVFTSSGTEGLNLLIRSPFAREARGHIITSSIEHAATYRTIEFLEQRGCTVTFLHPSSFGSVDVEDLKNAIRPDTQCIVLNAANSETGVKNDIEAFGQIAKNAQIPLIVDGVALLGKEEFTIPEGVSAMAFSGHKLHGPKGVGFIFARFSFKVAPLIIGGGQEYGRRSGTENLLGIIGLARAVELLKDELPEASAHMARLRDKLQEGLLQHLEGVVVNGSGPRICNTTNLSFHDVDGESLLIHLDMAGIAVSHGSACSSGSLEPSRVLIQMGIPKEIAKTAVRFSLSRLTTEEEVDMAIERTVDIVQKIRLITASVG